MEKIKLTLVSLLCVPLFALAGGGSGTEPSDTAPNVTIKAIYNVYDGDTFRGYIDDVIQLPIRIKDVDTPERKGKCVKEEYQAILARDFLKDILNHATTIELINPGKDRYDRVLAQVLVDGHDLSQIIIESGHGRAWRGRRESWCD